MQRPRSSHATSPDARDARHLPLASVPMAPKHPMSGEGNPERTVDHGYEVFTRERWAALARRSGAVVSDAEMRALAAIGEPISMEEVQRHLPPPGATPCSDRPEQARGTTKDRRLPGRGARHRSLHHRDCRGRRRRQEHDGEGSPGPASPYRRRPTSARPMDSCGRTPHSKLGACWIARDFPRATTNGRLVETLAAIRAGEPGSGDPRLLAPLL